MRRSRSNRIGVWLGMLAVALNALLPIHAAADIAHAASHLAAGAHPAAANSAPASHHHEHPTGPGHHHDEACPLCAFAAAAPPPAAIPAPIGLEPPAVAAAAVPATTAESARLGATLTPYAPRGPPTAA